MPFSDSSLLLQHIAEAIDAIEEFTQGMDFEAFRTDTKTIAAVERKLLIISEAAIRLGDRAEALCPGVQWRGIRGIGNWIRHQYDQIDLELIWKTVSSELPDLRAAVNAALGR